jgi:hypothetical protein
VVRLGVAGRNEARHPTSILQTFQHGSKPDTQVDVSSHDDGELQGYGLPRSFTPSWSGSPAARRPAPRQDFKAARLNAIDASQEGDQGGGKGRAAATFSLWVGGGVVIGLTVTAVRPDEEVLTPGSGVRLRSSRRVTASQLPQTASQLRLLAPPPRYPSEGEAHLQVETSPPLLPLLLPRSQAEEWGKKPPMGLVARRLGFQPSSHF